MVTTSVMADSNDTSLIKECHIRDSAIMVSEGSERNESTELQAALKTIELLREQLSKVNFELRQEQNKSANFEVQLRQEQDKSTKLEVRLQQHKNRIKDQNKKVKIHERKEIVERSRRKALEVENQRYQKAEESQEKLLLALETENRALGTDKCRLEDELTKIKVGTSGMVKGDSFPKTKQSETLNEGFCPFAYLKHQLT